MPGRAFTRRMYAKMTCKTRDGVKLKQHHHVRLDKEFRDDCQMWINFLEEAGFDKSQLCRPFLDLHIFETSEQLGFFTDASGKIGFGCYYSGTGRWTFGLGSKTFLRFKLSIAYQELFVLCVGILAWAQDLANKRIIIFCDNKSIVDMVNNTTSRCKNCMILIRKLVLNNLRFNRRISVKYLRSEENLLANSLSRGKFEVFFGKMHHCKRKQNQMKFQMSCGQWRKFGLSRE